MNLHEAITQAFDLNHRLQHLLNVNQEERVAKPHGERHVRCEVYWALTVEHHQAMLHLIESDYRASAFALLRCFEEAFLRSFVAMYGTENEVAALRDDKYNAKFEELGKRMDKKLGVDMYGQYLKMHIKTLHSLTHGGHQQWLKFISVDTDHIGIATIEPKFDDEEVLAAVMGTVLYLLLAARFITEFWGLTSQHQTVKEMFREYLVKAASALGINVGAKLAGG